MEGGVEEEDDDGEEEEEDPAIAMTARMERRAARRARRASAPALTSTAPTTTFRPAPSQWSVEEVTAFIHTLPGEASPHLEEKAAVKLTETGAKMFRLPPGGWWRCCSHFYSHNEEQKT